MGYLKKKKKTYQWRQLMTWQTQDLEAVGSNPGASQIYTSGQAQIVSHNCENPQMLNVGNKIDVMLTEVVENMPEDLTNSNQMGKKLLGLNRETYKGCN